MNNYGVILKKLRLVNRLTIKEAAKKIGKSTGWICEAENAKGATRIFPDEFERVVIAYGGDAYRKQFGGWIAKASQQSIPDAKLGAVSVPQKIIFTKNFRCESSQAHARPNFGTFSINSLSKR